MACRRSPTLVSPPVFSILQPGFSTFPTCGGARNLSARLPLGAMCSGQGTLQCVEFLVGTQPSALRILTRQRLRKGAMIQDLLDIDISNLCYKDSLATHTEPQHVSRFPWIIATHCRVSERPWANPLARLDMPLRTMLSSLHPQPLA